MKARVFSKTDICIKECEEKILNQKRKLCSFKSADEYYKLPDERKNHCTNKKDPKNLTDKEYLREFAKGPCSPMAIVPPLFGSKLEVVITDCQKFKKNYPQINNKCDLGTCSNKKPWKIYNLWMTDFFSPLSIFSVRQKYIKCFGEFMNVLYDYDKKEQKYKLVKKEGLEVRVKGIEKNGKKSNCGQKSVSDITPNFLKFTPVYNPSFKYFYKYFVGLGYKVGLNLQFLPYDFRLKYEENDLNVLFRENVERLYKLNSKKVIIVTHSLGTTTALYQMKKNEKYGLYKKVGNFISAGGPFFGTSFTLFTLLNFFSDFHFEKFGISLGLSKQISEKVVSTNNSVYDLLPPNPKNFMKEKWFKWVYKRINHENYQLNDTYVKGANLLPSVNEKCYEGLVNNECRYNLENFFKPLVNFYNGDSIKAENIEDKISKYSKNQHVIKEVKNYQKNNDLYNYNPKVQQTFIFNNSIKTLEAVKYNRDVSDKIFGDKYFKPDEKIYRNGDGTISTYSVLYKAFKDAYEFENSKNKDYKPIKLLEFCSKYNRKNKKESFYDGQDNKLKHNVFKNNSYNGIECTMDNEKDKSKFPHAKLFLDNRMFDVMFNLVQLEEKVNMKDYDEYLKNLTVKEIKSYSEDCVQLRYIGYGYNH